MTRRQLWLAGLLMICASIALAQDVPIARTPHYRIRLYEEDQNPGAVALDSNYIDLENAIWSGDWGTHRFSDSTTTSLYLLRNLVYRDTTFAWLERTIAGDRFTLFHKVRSRGRSESNITSGVQAVSKGNDTTLAAAEARADGTVYLYGLHGIDFGGGSGSSGGGVGTGVTSFKLRTGAVTPQSGDYSSFYWLRSDTGLVLLSKAGAAQIYQPIGTYLVPSDTTTNRTYSDARYSLKVGSSSIVAVGTLTSGAIGSGFTVVDTVYTNAVSTLYAGTNITLTARGKGWTITAAGGSSGEINTASNLAGWGVGLWKDKSTYDLRFKRLKSGNAFATWADNTDSVTVTVDTSRYGTSAVSGFIKFSDWVAFNAKWGKSDTASSPGIPTINRLLDSLDHVRASIVQKLNTTAVGSAAYSDSNRVAHLDKIQTFNLSLLADNRAGASDTVLVKSDMARPSISISIDSSCINTTDTLLVSLPDYAIVVDSIGVWQHSGTTGSVVYKYSYATSARGSWTAVITSPPTITSVTTKTWASTINNATLPANGVLAIYMTTVTTKPKSATVHIVGKRQASGVIY